MYKFIEDFENIHGCDLCCLDNKGDCKVSEVPLAEEETGKFCGINNGYYILKGWNRGDKVRHKTNFTTEVFTGFSGKNREYFFSKGCRTPKKTADYVWIEDDNKNA